MLNWESGALRLFTKCNFLSFFQIDLLSPYPPKPLLNQVFLHTTLANCPSMSLSLWGWLLPKNTALYTAHEFCWNSKHVISLLRDLAMHDCRKVLLTNIGLSLTLPEFHLASQHITTSSLLHLLITCKLWEFKSQLMTVFFNGINHNYNKCQKKKQKQTKWIEIYQSQPTDVNFWPGLRELLFPESSVTLLMIDGSEKRKWLVEV